MKSDPAKGVEPKMRGRKIIKKKRILARGVKPKQHKTNGRNIRTGYTAKQLLCTCHKFTKENNPPNYI